MKQNELNFVAQKSKKRKGRGISAGSGKTAGRGTKGQKSRTGGSIRPGFEGGQNPLIRKIPKARGFKSFATQVPAVSTNDLLDLKAKEINLETLIEAGLVHRSSRSAKIILGDKPIDAKLKISTSKISAGALKAVEAAGGSFLVAKAEVPEKKTSKKSDEKSVKKDNKA